MLTTQISGFWCAGTSCLWSLGTATTAGAPALSQWMLISLAVAMAVMGGLLVKKVRTA